MHITLYSVPWCKPCQNLKKYLIDRGVTYEEITVSDNREERAEVMAVSGQNGVPVVVINGHVIAGFIQEEIDKYLGEGQQV